MFDQQHLYREEPVATPTQEGDLFHGYEVKNWDLSSRIYKIIGISAAVNILALLVVGQTSLLTMKGCDSPLVGSVCQVLDTIYVGSKLFGSDREYIDAVYDTTELGDADITFVDVTGVTPPLDYPEGYFQLANPVEYQASLGAVEGFGDTLGFGGFTSDIPGIPNGIPISPMPGGSLFDTPQKVPPSNPSAVDGDLPEFRTSPSRTPRPPVYRASRPRGGRTTTVRPPKVKPVTEPTPDDETVAEVQPSPTPEPKKTVEPTAPVNADAINNRPLVDLSNYVNDLIDKNLYKLDSPFAVRARGKLNKEGKFDKTTFKFLNAQSSDKVTVEVVQKAIEAFNDSGRLKYLEDLSGKDVDLAISQDAVNITAEVEATLESDRRANSIKSGLDLAISLAKSAKTGEKADQNDKDDLLLLQNASITTNGNKVLIKFFGPKEILLPMIQRKLAEQKAQPKQPNGNSMTNPGDRSGQ